MAHISAAENATIAEAFGSSSGYVMDFTNPTYEQFFRNDVGIAIYDDEYGDNGNSKGKRLHCFLEKTTDALAFKAINALWEYRKSQGWKPDYEDPIRAGTLNDRMEALRLRLKEGRRDLSGVEGDPASWLAKLSAQCRKITKTAFDAMEEATENNTLPETGNKAVLTLLCEQLEAMLPEDFPPSTIYSFKRHIGFNQRSDMRDIVRFDIPGIMEAAEKYVAGLAASVEAVADADHPFDVRGLIDEMFQRPLALALHSEEPDFHALVLSCVIRLGDRFRTVSGFPDDNGGLIGKAFSPTDPVLVAPADLTTDSNKNRQQGAMLLMQGVRAYYRNVYAHGYHHTDEDEALRALVLFSICADILASATKIEKEGAI